MYTSSSTAEMILEKMLAIVTFVYFANGYMASAAIIPVGGIFEGPNVNQELVFEIAIDMVNKHHPLPRHTLKPLSVHIEPDDVINAKQGVVIDVTWDKPFAALETACSILKEGVVSIFNLLSEDNSNTIQSLCDAKEIPVIQTMLDTKHERECCSINLFPHLPVLARAFADLVKLWNWKNFTIIYEKQQSLQKIAELLKIYNIKKRNVVIRQLSAKSGDYMNALKDIRKSGQTNFVLDCSTENLNSILKQAQQVGLMTGAHKYIIINLDMHTIDLSAYQHSETNITGFRLVDPLKPAVVEVARALQVKQRELDLEMKMDIEIESSHISAWKLQTSEVLLIDAVMLFAEVLRDLENFRPKPLFCNSSDSWEHGSTVFNYMKTKTLNGLTGTVEFDSHGFRTDFSLDLIELTEGGIMKFGSWSSRNNLEISRVYPSSEKPDDKDSLRNMSFTVAICWAEPYAMYKDLSSPLTGNDQYEGFAIDIIQELAKLEGFNYTFIRNEQDKNGDYNKITKKWNGMIGDVLAKKADLAISDLTITKERERFVDFTEPFMSLGVQILFKKPKKAAPGFFSFAEPFALDVWFLIVVTFVAMSIMFYIVARICPAEWYNPYPCLEKPRYFVNQYHMGNCFWLIAANLLQSGIDVAPRGISTRVLQSFWMFFMLIMLSTYTANMAAFLTAEKEQWLFTDVKQLVNRADKLGITYGAVANGATHKLFKESENELYKKVAAYMEAHPELMVPVYENGVTLVEKKDKNYAFFMESSSIKYITERHCDLTSVGPFLDQKYYGIAMRPGSSYRNRLSAAVLHLQESGKLDALQRKWWQKERGGGECVSPPFQNAPPLYYQHVSGIIWITSGGIVLACVFVFIELAFHIIKKYRKNRQRMEEFKKELIFYFKFEEMVKPIENKKSVALVEESKNEDAAKSKSDSKT